MGCGISMLDAEDASQSRHSNRLRQHTIVRPVTDNNLANRKVFGNGDEGVDSPGKQSRKSAFSQGKDDVIVVVKPLGDEEAKTKLVGSNDEKLKEKSVDKEVERAFVSGGKEEHGGDDKHAKNEENMDSDDSFIGPGSPSFRDYCIDYDSGDRSSVGDFNDCDSGESTKNGSDDDSTKRKDKPKNEEVINSNKEPEKKERRGRRFRNVINKGKARGKRNLLNFACYNSSSASYAEGSLNKIVGKTA